MNYEQKYKEALEKARQFSEHPLEEDSSSIVEYIFPELQGIEDEKIRKWLIDWAKAVKWSKKFTISKKQLLAWLEKPDNPNPYSGTSFKHNGHTWGMCARDYGVEVMIDRKLVAFINPDGDVNSMVKSMVESYQKRLANECNASVESPLVQICLTSYRHGIENTIDELELNGLNKRPE